MRVEGKGLERTYAERDTYRTIVEALEQRPPEETKMQLPLVKGMLESHEKTIQAIEEDKPLVASWYANAPEIYTAMDLHWYCTVTASLMGMSAHLMNDLEQAEKLAVPTDVCTILRLGMYGVEAGVVPIPTVSVAMLTPCDGLPVFHGVIQQHKDWRHIPMFGADPTYWRDERSIEYYAEELKRMVSFLEENTGHKMDLDRLRETIEESNKQYALWAEFNELRRVVPCPSASFQGTGIFGVAQSMLVGKPSGTEWIRNLLAESEQRVREGKGWLENEKIRLLWFDLRPTWAGELAPWLEQEWNANVVMDMFSYCPYTQIDTSSEDSIYKGLAKRYLSDTPMIRQARGLAENFEVDIVRAVKDYSIDCFVLPGHMGHKDASASIGMMREICRDIGVPFLHIGLDLFDPRYTTMDSIKNTMSQFFTAMGLG